MKEITLYIKDMCCEGEAGLIRTELNRLKGIKDYEINIASGSVKITYNHFITSVQDILNAIAGTGMKAEIRAGKSAKPMGAWWKDAKVLTLSFCGILIFLSFILEHIFGLPNQHARLIYGSAILIGGYFPAKMGIIALKTMRPNIRTLMVTGAIGAIILNLWEEAALLIFIYSLGDILEAYATGRVRNAVMTLMDLVPKEAIVKREKYEVILALEEIRPDDILIIKPGEMIPLDGEVVSGLSSVDQSSITGESIPVTKANGDKVFAGSINQRGSLEVRVTNLFNDTTLGKIIHYVEEAEARKSGYQRFGERFGRYYTPFMFILAMTVMFIPAAITGNWAVWFYKGLVVLVVSCSCGIALSIPVSVVSAIANAARHGVLIKGGVYIEKASLIKAIAFDKTGTLTVGKPEVTEIISFSEMSEDNILRLVLSIESRSEHLLADAVLKKAKERGIDPLIIEGFEAIPGVGAKGMINGVSYCIGNRVTCNKTKPDEEERIRGLEEHGNTLIFLTREESMIGVIAVRDEIRPETKGALNRLRESGINGLIMLTGDNENVAGIMAERAGLTEFKSQLLPEDKVRAIEILKEEHGQVAMVGDGVNDAPAMVTSDLAIAMGAAGTDLAIETGDIVLMSDDLNKIPYAIDLSKRAARNIRQNITLSLIIIVVLIPLALIGWIGLVPGLLINEVSGLLAILNGLRLLGYRPPV